MNRTVVINLIEKTQKKFFLYLFSMSVALAQRLSGRQILRVNSICRCKELKLIDERFFSTKFESVFKCHIFGQGIVFLS